jgi:hypothetical protein
MSVRRWLRENNLPIETKKSPADSLRSRYGITHEEAEALLAITECQICGRRKNLCVDHDHKTGKVRGRLCNFCNLSLGWLENWGEEIDDYLGSPND